MKLIQHSRNTISELKKTPIEYGIEVDIRSEAGKLITHHDPFKIGEQFEKWLNVYKHGTLILNVKEEGLEDKILALMNEHNIEDYFFLDQSFPFLIKWSNAGMHKSAVRVSEFESVENALLLKGKVDWVWVDCFTRFPLNQQDIKILQDAGFKLCIVSPELQGHPILWINDFTASMKGFKIDAVCTKRPELWK
ncbi:MAG: hypothetical protein Q8R50_12230 [Sediminibacterium sp.]|nr:hypothetical protein [Sediminibacterium sp.]